MAQPPTPRHVELWNSYLSARTQFQSARNLLLAECGSRPADPIVSLLKLAFQSNRSQGIPLVDKSAILDVVAWLPPETQVQLFEDLFFEASQLETTLFENQAAKIFALIPSEMVREKIELRFERIITRQPDLINTGLLEFAEQIDRELVYRLAQTAATQDNDYLQQWSGHNLRS